MTESDSVLLEANKLPAQFLLEAQHYLDPRWEAVEQQRIFRDSWLYLGDRAQLSPGQVWSTTVAGRSIVVTCSLEGELKGFYNLCPHRAARLCPEPGIQSAKQLLCPYHAWVYGLDGELLGVPLQDRFPHGFDPGDYSLQAVRVETWSDFLFVCFAERGPSLEEYLGLIPTQVGQHRRDETQLLLSKSRAVACNWKNYHDNTLCDYHVAIAHRETLNVIQGPIKYYGHQFGFYTNLLHTPVTAKWQAENRSLPGVTGLGQDQLLTYGIFPNLHLIAAPSGLMAWIRIDPLTPETCQVDLEVYGIPEYSPAIAQLEQDFGDFMAEDVALVESVQRGYASGHYQPGPVHQLEARIVHQQKLILGRLGDALP